MCTSGSSTSNHTNSFQHAGGATANLFMELRARFITLVQDSLTQPLRVGLGLGVSSSNSDDPFLTATASKKISLFEGDHTQLTAKARLELDPRSSKVSGGCCCNGQGITSLNVVLPCQHHRGWYNSMVSTDWRTKVISNKAPQQQWLAASGAAGATLAEQQAASQEATHLHNALAEAPLQLQPIKSVNRNPLRYKHDNLNLQQLLLACCQHPLLCITLRYCVETMPLPLDPLPTLPTTPPPPPRCRAQGRCVCPVASWTSQPTRTCSSRRGWTWTGRAPHEQQRVAAAAANSKR